MCKCIFTLQPDATTSRAWKTTRTPTEDYPVDPSSGGSDPTDPDLDCFSSEEFAREILPSRSVRAPSSFSISFDDFGTRFLPGKILANCDWIFILNFH